MPGLLSLLSLTYILFLCCDSSLEFSRTSTSTVDDLSNSFSENGTLAEENSNVQAGNPVGKYTDDDLNFEQELTKRNLFANTFTEEHLNVEENKDEKTFNENANEVDESLDLKEKLSKEFIEIINGTKVNINLEQDKLKKVIRKSDFFVTSFSSFSVNHDRGVFLLNGEVFVMISGKMQYYRIPRPYWRDRLRSMRSAGFNTLHVSIEWSTHEPKPNVYKFVGDEDFILFLRLAQEEGLQVVANPGPFTGAERDFGGLPAWLLWESPGMKLRSNDAQYKARVSKYMLEVLSRLKHLLIEHGGPVIMIEIEVGPDPEYSAWLVTTIREHLGSQVVMITNERKTLHQESPRYSQVNFLGIKLFDTFKDTRLLSYTIRKIQPNGPHLCNYYLGWGTLWGHQPNSLSATKTVIFLRDSLSTNKSVSISSFHGGTDFGFKSGSTMLPGNNRYASQTTSYDVGAPLDEAGDPTDKYHDIKHAIDMYFPHLGNRSSPPVKPKMNLEGIKLQAIACLLDYKTIPILSANTFYSTKPLTFEELRQSSGFVLYETSITKRYSTPLLRTPELKDRAQVYVNQKFIGLLSRSKHSLRLYLPDVSKGARLQIFVENQGREYWQPQANMIHYKGLAYSGDVRLNNEVLTNWTMHGYSMDDLPRMQQFADEILSRGSDQISVRCTPTLYSGAFQLSQDLKTPFDTFLDLSGGWVKGVAIVNGRNLGRYWPHTGPQETLYLPGCYLLPYPHTNKIMILELERTLRTPVINLEDHHISNEQSRPVRQMGAIAIFVLLLTLMLMLTYGGKCAQWVRGNT